MHSRIGQSASHIRMRVIALESLGDVFCDGSFKACIVVVSECVAVQQKQTTFFRLIDTFVVGIVVVLGRSPCYWSA
jgi:hypothetical protein